MAIDIYMPQLGLTMTQGNVIRWLKSEGQAVRKGEPLVEIETDKVKLDLESPADGILGPILVREGASIPIGQVLGHVLAPGEQSPQSPRLDMPIAPTSAAAPSKPAMIPQEAAQSGPKLRVSPLARRLAQELGVDLQRVEATGPEGRIVADDVRRAAESIAPRAQPVAPSTVERPRSPSAVPAGTVEPLRGVRRVVAERMTHSFTTTPHFYLSVETEATELLRLRDSLLAAVEAANGAHLTVTDVLIRIVAQALQEHPEVNVAWGQGPEGGGQVRQEKVNLGFAVATADGLVVPVIHGAAGLSLAEIARRRSDLADEARDGKLSLADLEGGTFTLTNLGMFGIDEFHAIINPPQSAILAVGRIKERPVASAGSVVVRPTMFLTLSADHRLLDGVQAARFLQRVTQLIEEPYLLIA